MGNLIKVEILGQEYTLRTKTDEAKVIAAAELVKAKTEEYQKATRSTVKLNVAILAALDIANEYLHLRDSQDSIQERLEARSQEILQAIKAIEAEV